MNQVSQRLAAVLGVVAAGLLAACASSTTAPQAQVAEQTAKQAGDDKVTLTGSRIPRKSTDRLLRSTDAAGAAEMERSRAPESGPKFN